MKNSTSETGFAKNVAVLLNTIIICESMGTLYNPSRESLQVAAMRDLLTKAEKALEALSPVQARLNDAIIRKVELVDTMHDVVRRSISSLIAVGTQATKLESARSLQRKLNGQRVGSEEEVSTEKREGAEEPVIKRRNSVSQLSMDNRINNFVKFVDFVTAVPGYQPNENDLKPEALRTLVQDMKAANQEVLVLEQELDTLRLARNASQFDENEGIHSIFRAVKNYVKSVKGAESYYNKLTGLTLSTKKKI